MGEALWRDLGSVVEAQFTEEAIRSRPGRLGTGFPRLDELLDGGISPGLTVLGGSPGLGKSTFVLQVAEHVARGGVPVLYFSLEMSGERIAAKALSRRIFQLGEGRGVTAGQLTSADAARRFSGGQWERIRRAGEDLGSLRGLCVVEEPLSAGEIVRTAEEFLAGQGGGRTPLVVVDYLQILSAGDGRARGDKQAVDESLRRMAELTQMGSPVFLVSSLNRSSYTSPMQLDAFKETGGIEYSADVLLGLQFCACHRQGKWDVNEEKRRSPRSVEIVVLKQRYGASGGAVRFRYYAQFDCFAEETAPGVPAGAPGPVPAEQLYVPPDTGPAADERQFDPSSPDAPPPPPRRRFDKGEASYINNTKIANEIRSGSAPVGEAADCRVFGDVVTRYELSAPLTAFDCNVADAVYTLYRREKERFTPGMVLRVLSGDGKQTITGSKKKEILGSLEKLRTTQIKIDCTEEMRARRRLGEKSAQRFEGPCLSAARDGERFRFTGPDPMPLYAYGEQNTQMICFPQALLEVPAGRGKLTNTAENICLKRFLIRRLEVLRSGQGRGASGSREFLRRISLQKKPGGLVAELGIGRDDYPVRSDWGRKRRTICRTVLQVLEYYQRCGYIGGFAESGGGIQIEGEVRDAWGLSWGLSEMPGTLNEDEDAADGNRENLLAENEF